MRLPSRQHPRLVDDDGGVSIDLDTAPCGCNEADIDFNAIDGELAKLVPPKLSLTDVLDRLRKRLVEQQAKGVTVAQMHEVLKSARIERDLLLPLSLDQTACQPRPAQRRHRGLRRRLDHRATAGTGAAHRGSDRGADERLPGQSGHGKLHRQAPRAALDQSGMTKPSGKRIALNKLSLTKRTVEALKPAAKSWIAWDDTLTGFGIRVQPTGIKSYIVNYRAGDGGRKAPNKRVVLGRRGGITAEQARHMAQRVLREAATGDGLAGAVTHKPFADALAVAAQDVALPVAALLFQVAIEGVPAREPGKRRHEVPPGIADHPLHNCLCRYPCRDGRSGPRRGNGTAAR